MKVSDMCLEIGKLSREQVSLLESLGQVFGLSGDIAHAQVTIYVEGKAANTLTVIDQVRPNTSFIQYKPNAISTTVHAFEEPLIWETLHKGKKIRGKREWALGMLLEMQTFPIYDRDGNIIAAVSFETSSEEMTDEGILIETANMLLNAGPLQGDVYKRLSPRDGLLIISSTGKVVFADAAAGNIYKVLGVPKIVGKQIYDRRVNLKLVQKALYSGQPLVFESEVGGIVLLQRAIPICLKGQVKRVILIIVDVTELKKKEKELQIKSAVIQEIHHRVKNNLQTIASLLRLQARRSKSEEVKAALRESVNRIVSISVVHEFLSQHDAEFIDVAEVARNIFDLVIQTMIEPGFAITKVFNGQTVILPSHQATSLALVINELIQNSIEHGFAGKRKGALSLEIRAEQERYCVEIWDDGMGLPPDFNVQGSSSLGLQIVRTLVETDLGGEFKIFTDRGTHACIIIPRTMEVG